MGMMDWQDQCEAEEPLLSGNDPRLAGSLSASSLMPFKKQLCLSDLSSDRCERETFHYVKLDAARQVIF